MYQRILTIASCNSRTVALLCTSVAIISLASCDSSYEQTPGEINNENLQISLDPGVPYEWRVRAITAQASGPWSTTVLLETDTNTNSEKYFDVTYTAHNELLSDESLLDEFVIDEFYDPLLNDNYNPLYNDKFNPLFNDGAQQSLVPATKEFNGVPKFSWEHDNKALAYEIEMVRNDTLQRVGMFQYPANSVCIDATCEIVLDNTQEQSVNLAPILLISHTVVQGAAPYQVNLPSPVVELADVSTYSHEWSIEGRYIKFPNSPEFRHEFTDAGSYTVNVRVTSANGRSEHAYSTVITTESSNTVDTVDTAQSALVTSGAVTSAPEATESTDTPTKEGEATVNVLATLPVSTEKTVDEENPVPPTSVTESPDSVDNSDNDNSSKELQAPEVTVSNPSPAEVAELSRTEETKNQSTPEPVVEQPAVESIAGGDTTQEPISANDWNNDMPNGGRAIGVVTSGISTGNSRLVRHKSARRFMATRSGAVKSFGYHNRILSAADIELRAETRRTSQPIWYEIQQAVGNDPKRGGYMLNNSYSVGNGGLQEVTLQTDDGTSKHNPSGTVIAKAKPYIPFDLPAKQWVIIDFESPGNVVAGQIYHLVYENLNPPPNLSGLSGSEAQRAPSDKGAISLDGTTDGYAIDPSERHGPFLRNYPATRIKTSESSTWKSTDVTSWYSIVYTDDVEVGETYAHFQGAGAYRYRVDGNKQLRQEFTWDYPNITVDRIATRFGHDSDANGRSMSVVIKNQSLSTIATTSVPYDSELKDAAKSSNTSTSRQTRHSVGSLSSPVQLVTGQKYYVEYSAASGARYVMAPAIETNRKHGNSDRNLWGAGAAKQSEDNGSSWKNLDAFPDSDLPMYFIPVGIPTQTPEP